MPDLVFLGSLVAFFGLAALLVRACDRVIGPESVAPRATTREDEAASELAA